jgi:choline dehydrogenase-like flavoprotein
MTTSFDVKRRRETLRAAAIAILPEDCPEGVVDAVVADFIEEIALQTEALQAQFGGFVDALDKAVAVALLGGRFAGLRSMSRAEAERMFVSMATHPVPQLRAGFSALRRAITFIAYGRSDERGNPLWARIDYPGPRNDRPHDAGDELLITALEDAPDEVDVVVVGSGAGGGVAAAVLAAAGKSVLVVEEGEYLPASRVDQRELYGFRRLFLDRGGTSSSDLGIGILAGRGVGGGTVINWNVSLRLSAEVAHDWDRVSGLKGLAASLAPHYDAVSQRLGLAPSPDNANNRALRSGCETLGWDVKAIPRNAAGCGAGCGYCTFGCAYGKKRDTPRTFLRDAVAAGARVVASAHVSRVLIEGVGTRRRAAGVEIDLGEGRSKRIRAKVVVVAGGSLRTPQILHRSGISARALGRHLHLHPATAMNGVFDHPIEPWLGAPMSAVCSRLCKMDGPNGVVIETAPVHPGLASVAIPWYGAASHARDVAALKRTAFVVSIVRDRDHGTITDGDPPTIDYKVSRYDGKNLLEGVAAIARILFAAGAREVYTTHVPPLRLSREDASEAALRRFHQDVLRAGHAPNRIAMFSAHQMGTARMAASARSGVVDERGAVFGVRGLLVADASTFPAASGVNPMLTIMAMAHRIASLHA